MIIPNSKDAESIPAEVQQFAGFIENRFALPYLKYTIEDVGALGAQSGANIFLSPKLMNYQKDTIKTVIAHEICHRAVMPVTVIDQKCHMTIAEIEKIPYARIHEFLNIIYDLVVDEYNLKQEWEDTYIKGLEDIRKADYVEERIDVYSVFINLCQAIMDENKHKKMRLNDIESEVFRLLYRDTRTFERRLVELARIFSKLYKDTPSKPPETISIGTQLPFDINSGCNEEDDAEGIAKKLSEIYKDLPNGYSNSGMDNKIQRHFRIIKAKKFAIPKLQALMESEKEKKITGTWHPGRPAYELDYKKTVSRFGVLIPSKTACKVENVENFIGTKPYSKQHLVIVADISSSMKGNKINRMIDAIISLNQTAKTKNWPLSLIVFDHRCELLHEKCCDYNAINVTASGLMAGGNTYINSALDEAVKISGKKSVFIFTDEDNYSLTDKYVINKLKALKSEGEVFLYCIGHVFDGNQKEILKNTITKAYSISADANYSGRIIADALCIS